MLIDHRLFTFKFQQELKTNTSQFKKEIILNHVFHIQNALITIIYDRNNLLIT